MLTNMQFSPFVCTVHVPAGVDHAPLQPLPPLRLPSDTLLVYPNSSTISPARYAVSAALFVTPGE
ncbi:MAG: hypothetical protein BWY59_00136 [Verrucomicrobia bacterium ADurb.Bin345]|nr:MAG: hypothetical protein BWY59_00136 [Verrucomicrobia bacterium ADurb.Bin345]